MVIKNTAWYHPNVNHLCFEVDGDQVRPHGGVDELVVERRDLD